MQAGEVDLGVITNPAVVEQVSEPLVLERTETLGYFPFFLNSSRGPLQERAVRQAISCAIDRQELIDTALLGEGVPTGPFVEGIYATDPYDGLPCDGPDQDLARQLLADGGYPDGFSIETIIITGESETNINLAQNLQAQLAEVGVDLELVQLETNVYVDRWLAADFDSALSENNSNPDPHLDVLPLLHLRRQLRQRRRADLAGAGRAVRPRVGRDRPRGAGADLRRDLAHPARGVAVGVAVPGLPLPGPVARARGLRAVSDRLARLAAGPPR